MRMTCRRGEGRGKEEAGGNLSRWVGGWGMKFMPHDLSDLPIPPIRRLAVALCASALPACMCVLSMHLYTTPSWLRALSSNAPRPRHTHTGLTATQKHNEQPAAQEEDHHSAVAGRQGAARTRPRPGPSTFIRRGEGIVFLGRRVRPDRRPLR